MNSLPVLGRIAALAVVVGSMACSLALGLKEPKDEPGNGTDAGGQAGSCSDVTQCPGLDTECRVRTCVGGACGFDNSPSGTPLAAQTAGDCKLASCDGNGASATSNDESDIFDDNNPCTIDVCSAGQPLHVPAPVGAPCSDANKGKYCDGKGACAECIAAADCASNICAMSRCIDATCLDGAKNGTETDQDCGGADCPRCGTGGLCIAGTDCASAVCLGGVCMEESCKDATKNGGETDTDCGGPICAKCSPGKTCSVSSDCAGDQCSGSSCIPNCSDGVHDNAETDIDCGGPTCKKCGSGKTCSSDGDCATSWCHDGTCRTHQGGGH